MDINSLISIISTIISLVGSFFVSLLTTHLKMRNMEKSEKEDNYYNKFHVLWDSIHRGRAYDFIDLSDEDQERIIDFFIETYRYQSNEERRLVYELKTSHLNKFDNGSKYMIDTANRAYRQLIELLVGHMCK